jgi:hypothetical protein
MTFSVLQIGRDRRFLEGDEHNDWESILCSKNLGHQRAGQRLGRLSVDILSGYVVDFSQTMLGDVVISDHARQILQAEGMTGFELRAVQAAADPIQFKNLEFRKLWEFVVTGRGGATHSDSGISLIRVCDRCGLKEYSAFENGIVVDESTYDGSDFFTVEEYPKYILCSGRAKSIMERSRLTNVSFVDSAEFRWPDGVEKPS